MQKYSLILAVAFTLVACTRSNQPGSQATYVDTLSRDYIVSTYSAGFLRYQSPQGLCIDQNGIFYSSNSAGWILKIPSSNTYSALDTLGLDIPKVVYDPAGNIIALVASSNLILKITPAGAVTLLAGGARPPTDGQGSSAGFANLADLTIDSTGTIYVADGDLIRKINRSGLVTTIYKDSSGSNLISAITVDRAGNLYYATGNQLWRLDPLGNKTLIAGSSTAKGDLDGPGMTATFTNVGALQIDQQGNLIAGDLYAVRQVTPAGTVGTIAGSDTSALTTGVVNGPGNLAKFGSVSGLVVDSDGAIFVADELADAIRKIVHK